MKTKKLIALALMCITSCAAMANEQEVNDTILSVNKPDNVTIINDGHHQKIIINGKDGNPNYQYIKEVELGEESVERLSEEGTLDLTELFSFNSDKTEIEKIINKFKYTEGVEIDADKTRLIKGKSMSDFLYAKIKKCYFVELTSCSKSVRKRFTKAIKAAKGYNNITSSIPGYYDTDPEMIKTISKVLVARCAPHSSSMSEFVLLFCPDEAKGTSGPTTLIYLIGNDIKLDEVFNGSSIKMNYKTFAK